MKTNRKQILIGLDIGTSSAKCIAIDTSGEVLADCSGEYPMAIPRHGWAEQNPEDWWKATMLCLRKITSSVAVQGNELLGLSLTGQMHGLVALDACDGVIRPAMLWCDQRCQEQCDHIIQLAGGIEGLLSFTNNTMLAGYTGGKLLWLKQKEPDHYERMKIFLCPKDYIRFLLTGEKGMDCSEASGTGFFDTKNRRWNQRLIELAGLRFDIFPEVRESIDLAGRISQKTAELTGLPEGLKVFFGGGDAVTQSTGSGLLEPGTLGIVIGTSGNVSMGLDHFFNNPQGKLQMFCNNEPGRWHVFGAPLSSGGAYRWYRDELGQHYAAEARQSGRNVYSLMDEDAARSVPGSHGVVFTPYLSGERCPYEDSEAKGVLYGLSLGTKRADITRAVMEGVTFSLRQVVELMGRFTECKNAVTSGGGSSSPLWRQMQADILNMPIYTTSTSDAGGAFGAAMLAGVGCGIWRNLSEASSLVKIETETLPDCKNQPAYEDAYAIYARLYPALKPVYSYHRGE